MTASLLFPRKQPRQRRAEATVDAVIEAAARILEKDGLRAYNTNAVARAAGVGIGSLYQYFPNKDAITRALMAREAGAVIAELKRLVGNEPGTEVVGRAIAALVRHLMLRPNLARILDLEERRLSLDEDVRASEDTVRGLLRDCLFDDAYTLLQDEPAAMPDIVAIIRGMVDSAAARGERDVDDLALRVERAVRGYVDHGSRSIKDAP